jgi:hypothetical protein
MIIIEIFEAGATPRYQPNPDNASDQDRHPMIQSLPTKDRYHSYACWLAARHSQARFHALNPKITAPAITLHNPHRAHSNRAAHPPGSAKITLHRSRSHFTSTADVPKSP